MKFFYYSFNEWKKLDKNIKQNFIFLSTAKTHPSYFQGQVFKPFVPEDQLFFDACKNFAESNFEERYSKQIFSLNHLNILNELKQFNSEIIVFLVWEPENKSSERDIFIPWLTKTNYKDIKAFSFSNYLINYETNSFSIFEL